ncbi:MULTISPECIES: penicillin-binding transpeptidase domain-containing protein [Streptomyces]|uniref:penicillin-binding transpeptidase domain-containing protein n=1 Tax=Streptomyces TaxID=1883 RepID=UPI00089575CB|nr:MULTISPECIES: penicillin-binding transpeptidase domain-containing protein [unclassified Streptomyces]SEC65031.1 NTF2-like N-terminal transpeptidase domain-containing protein [Streptomyces sp. PAN_FS17]SED14449.1 NTF2-like N-terminal transpeptidase domain-containing protein [Streptomyces sp. KS_5]
MPKGVKVAVIGGVFAVMVGGAGYGAYNIVSALNGGGATGAAGPASERTGPPDADEVEETTSKFFAAWEKGEAAQASTYTDNDAAAEALLSSYGESAHITGVTITPGAARGTTVPFTVKAKVSYEGKSKPLTYKSELTVVRGRTTGRALVDWQPTVVHPQLKRDDTLVTGEAANPPIEAVDRDGAVLTKEKYPSLGPVLDTLRERYGDKAGGEPGVELSIRHADESPDTSLLTLSKGRPGKLETTLSSSAQAAAEKAVRKYANSSVVAVKPSTGEVLAVANHRDDAFNAAFEGRVAPGSTMKILTAAMLIDNGVTTMNGPAPCPPTATWQSQTFKNLDGLKPDESANATLASGFLRSCNTAFIKLVDEDPLTDASLTAEAEERFGLGRGDWKTGIVSFDGSVPASAGPDRAANAIGQGQVQMSPLNMASVTATAITGTFRQPYLVSPALDDRQLATAKGLRASTAAQLKQMMRLTATSAQGTAVGVMSGLGGDIGAKTGSAEVDGQATSDSWFTGFRNDVAAAAMTEKGGHGGDAAGPIVAAVLRAAG